MKYIFTTIITILITSNSFGIAVLSNKIYFEFDSYELTPASKTNIDKSVENLKTKNNIWISGYADNIGDTLYNRLLSQKRANSVKSYLIEKGVPTSSIQFTFGYGESSRHSRNRDNRSVDISIHDLAKAKSVTKKFDLNFDITNNETEKIDSTKSEIEPLNKSIKEIVELEIGQTLTIKGLNFIPGHHYLLKGSEASLKELVKVLKDNPTLKIEIQGHICCTPSGGDGMDQDTHTMNLSINRAQYVYNYLIENDISPYRLSFKGFGASKPLVEEITEADRIKNRRVEIMIVEK